MTKLKQSKTAASEKRLGQKYPWYFICGWQFLSGYDLSTLNGPPDCLTIPQVAAAILTNYAETKMPYGSSNQEVEEIGKVLWSLSHTLLFQPPFRDLLTLLLYHVFRYFVIQILAGSKKTEMI